MSPDLAADPITSDLVREARLELFETIEEISSATGLLRESYNDLDDNNNLLSATMTANDALEIIASLETKFSQIAASLASWIEYAENEASEDDSEEVEPVESAEERRMIEGDYRRDEMIDRQLERERGEA